jgi:hypothetical protein
MMEARSACWELVQQLARLDGRFALEYAPDLCGGDDYPYAIMGSYAAFLCDRYHGGDIEPLLHSALELIERALREDYHDVQNMIEVSFVEQLFYGSQGLFLWALGHSGELLKYEFLAFQANERGYRLINAVKEVFGPAPPDSMQPMTKNTVLLRRLAELGVPVDDGTVLDPWGHPYRYHLERERGGATGGALIHVTSLASLRGHGRDVQVIGDS